MNDLFLNRSDILDSEKRILRANGIKLKEIHHRSIRELKAVLNVSEIRAMELRAISEFQTGSIIFPEKFEVFIFRRLD